MTDTRPTVKRKEADMPETETFLNRIGRLFKRPSSSNGGDNGAHDGSQSSVTVETHPITLRPWRKNTEAIANLQNGFQSLTELMNEIRQNMVNQGRRQDELNGYLSALPKLLESIPESSRVHAETLKAMQAQLERQGNHQETLGEILEKMAESDGDQKALLEGLRERVETLNHQDKAMADSLGNVSAALEQSTRHSAAGTQVLQSLRENLKNRDDDLEKVIQRQNARFTILLIVAISVSVAALFAVGVMGYFLTHHANT
jgi:RNA binding exosome subunit